MKGLKKKRRIQVIVIAFVAMAASFAAFYYASSDALQYYRTPTDVAESPPDPSETFRIGGLVEEGSLVRGQGTTITFSITDTNKVIPVRYEGVLPDLFGENEGVVAAGKLIDGTLVATEILAKHDETYMPKEVVDALKEQGVYVDPNGQAATN